LDKLCKSRADIRELATIDLKAKETALLTWCERENIALRIIPKDLVAIRPWVTQPSDWVHETLGLEGVCEPCALLAGHRTRLLLPKTSLNGVSIAVAEETGNLIR
ncbi:MAG: cobalamin biosynthesis protein, partial [Verrucomicrobia bacterium]|nr:cobalamin biosynthesis protein [Verrucomicrobiota bacterium]